MEKTPSLKPSVRAVSFRSARSSMAVSAGDHAVVEPDAGVPAVAERLVGRDAAAAQRDAVAHLVALAVRRLDGDAALDPQGSAAGQRGVLDDADGLLELGLDGLGGLVVVHA